jgi:molybdopterin synthase sulfur carrier subunit
MAKVKLFATLVEIAKRKEIEIEAKTAREVLDKLKGLYGSSFEKELEHGMIFLVNGRDIAHLQGLDTPVNEDDVISLFPPIGGG